MSQANPKRNPSYASVDYDDLWALKERHLKRALKARLAGNPALEARCFGWAVAVTLEELIRSEEEDANIEMARGEMEAEYECLIETGRVTWEAAPEPATREPPLAAAPLKKPGSASMGAILGWFQAQPKGGTVPEAARALSIGISSVSTYCSQLIKRGLLRETGRKRGLALPDGRLMKAAAIREVTPDGIQALEDSDAEEDA